MSHAMSVPDDHLLDALDRLRGAGPEFGGFLANHGPMGAEALTILGATEGLGSWVERYRTRLDVAPSAIRAVPVGEWRDHLGDPRLLGEWIVLMRHELAGGPWREVLARWWPRLLPGLAASATHGVIRTAHAVRTLGRLPADTVPDALLVDEVAQGLAYWAARYQTLPGAPGLAGRLDAVTAMRSLPRVHPRTTAERPGIQGRLELLADVPEFAPALDAWKAPADPATALDRLIEAGARVLAAREDAPIAFCHAVTAPAAVRMTLPHLPVSVHRPTVAATWQVVGAIIAAYAAPRSAQEMGAATWTGPRDQEGRPAPAALDDLVGQAAHHGDEHVIKLTEAALREYRRGGAETLLIAAERFRGRIDPTI